MNDLRELYQEVIFDHYRKPRNFHSLAEANHHAEGFNPLCGDRLTLYLQIDENGVIEEASFEGTGCAISIASASLLTEHVKGKRAEEVDALFKRFHDMLTREHADAADMGKLEVLAGVKEFPARVKCATLAWHTLRAALEDRKEPVHTE